MLKTIFQLMRPHQYIKNSFVFVGVIFSHQWALHNFISAFSVFAVFCLIASSIYIINDIVDIDNDRQHPKKCKRPLPSGKLSISCAYSVLGVLLVGALIGAWSISSYVFLFVLSYFLLNILYCLWLKNIVIIDIFTISMGFMCRIFAGTLGLGILPSQWLLLCGFMITLFLGFSKRFSELTALQATPQTIGTTRTVLRDYSIPLLERFMTICATCTIMCYGLYTVAPETLAIHGDVNLIYSLPIVAYGILRYLYLVCMCHQGGDTSRDIVTDKHMLVTMMMWLSVIIGLLV